MLIVDDCDGDADLIASRLAETLNVPIDAEQAPSLADGLHALGESPRDAVIADLHLGDASGEETITRLRAAAPTLPLIAVSGQALESLRSNVLASGADELFDKRECRTALFSRSIQFLIERNRARAEHRELEKVLDANPDAVLVVSLTGDVRYVNEAAVALFQRSADEIRSERLGFSIAEGPPSEICVVRPGSRRICEMRVSTLEWWGERVLLASMRDVTTHKAAVDALRDSEARFRQLADNTAEVFFIVDAKSGRILYLNPAYERVWGRPLRDAYTERWAPLSGIVAADSWRVQQHMMQLTKGVNAGDIEFRVARPDGSIRWLSTRAVPIADDDSGDVFRLAGVAVDVTERRQGEEALRESERRSRRLFDAVRLIVLGLDRVGRVEYVNPFFLEVTGYRAEEVIGAMWFDQFVPSRLRAAQLDAFHELMRHDSKSHHSNAIRTRHGQERLIAWNDVVLRDSSGTPTGSISIGEDVTDRTRFESQFREAQKMEAVGRLAGGVAHDFNNLLTVINGNTEMLAAREPNEDMSFELLDEIASAGHKAALLTRQLLAFSRRQVLEPKILLVNEIIEDAHRLLQRVIGEDIDLSIRLAPSLPAISADPGQLQQALLNLAVNARDAMPRGGHLTIESSIVELDAEAASERPPLSAGRYVRISVSDSGVGITEEVQRRIFEPFFTTKDVDRGTGLGLAMVHGFVTQSGGRIEVYSEVGVGTTFQIYLPTSTARPTPEPVVAKQVKQRGTETILLAEDDSAVRLLVSRTLEQLGYHVLSAPNGGDALALAEGYHGEIHLIVTDVVMPGLSGRELVERLIEQRPGVRTLYLSGYTDDAVVRHGILEHSVQFLQKPFGPAVLAKKVRAVLD